MPDLRFPMESLKEHAIPIISTLFFITTGLVGLVWRGNSEKFKNLSDRLEKIEGKIDKFIELHYECQKRLPEVYVRREDMLKRESEEYAERKERWDTLNQTLARIEQRLENHITAHNH